MAASKHVRKHTSAMQSTSVGLAQARPNDVFQYSLALW